MVFDLAARVDAGSRLPRHHMTRRIVNGPLRELPCVATRGVSTGYRVDNQKLLPCVLVGGGE